MSVHSFSTFVDAHPRELARAVGSGRVSAVDPSEIGSFESKSPEPVGNDRCLAQRLKDGSMQRCNTILRARSPYLSKKVCASCFEAGRRTGEASMLLDDGTRLTFKNK